MAGTIFGEYSKDGYGYWGYVETEKRMMLFTSPEEYHEYIFEPRITRITPPIMKGVQNHEDNRT